LAILLTKPTDRRVTGTPGYMAPEQLSPNLPQDQRTDVFGLGTLLYTMLKGEPPLKQQLEEASAGASRVTDSIPTLSVTGREIPESLIAIVMKAMLANPTDRYRDVDELIDDIKRYKNGYTPIAENAGFVKELVYFLRRNQTLCSVVGIASLALVTLTGIFIFYRLQSRQKEYLARLESENALRMFVEEKNAREVL